MLIDLRGLIGCVALSTLLCFAASAQSQEDKTSSDNSDVQALPPEGYDQQAKALVKVRISVPQMNNRTDTVSFYPYITKPPKLKVILRPIPEDDKAIKGMLISSGYLNRDSLTRPYPDIGWRWQYAYRNAQKRAGGSEPQVVGGIYKWADNMLKYVKPEVERINRIEAVRNERYMKCLTEFEDGHKDEEMEALRLGLEPVAMPLKGVNKNTAVEGYVSIKPGDWYVVSTHKTPGLTYYWQEKVRIKPGERIVIGLNDSNAMLIQGAW